MGILSGLAFAALLNHYHGQAESLRATGVAVPGQVESLTLPARGIIVGSAVIRYRAAGHTFRESVVLGNDAHNYRVGQTVTVHYERHHPSRMTIGDEQNQPEWTVIVMIGLAVVAVPTVLASLAVLSGISRTSRVLASQPWRSTVANVVTRGTSRRRRTWLLIDGHDPLRLHNTWDSNEAGMPLQVASRGRRTVVSVPGRETLEVATPPRRLPADIKRLMDTKKE